MSVEKLQLQLQLQHHNDAKRHLVILRGQTDITHEMTIVLQSKHQHKSMERTQNRSVQNTVKVYILKDFFFI